MKYLDFYNPNQKVVKALFGIKLFGSKNEDIMPELDTSNQDSIKAWQDWAVRNGHMTQDQVDTGYGIYGSKTRAAYANAQAANQSNGSTPTLTHLSRKEASEMYQQGPGIGSSAWTAIHHVLTPEWGKASITPGIKKQVVAAVSNKGVSNEWQKAGYGTWNQYNGQSGDASQQSSTGNAVKDTHGKMEYRLSPDGKSIEVKDDYYFGIPWTIDENGKWNDQRGWDNKEYETGDDAYTWYNKPWKNLKAAWYTAKLISKGALNSEKTGLPIEQNVKRLGEAFATIQGKKRDHSYSIPIEKANQWIDEFRNGE